MGEWRRQVANACLWFYCLSLLFIHHAEVPESVRFVQASGGGCVDHEDVAKSIDSMLASTSYELQIMMDLVLRLVRKLKDFLCL